MIKEATFEEIPANLKWRNWMLLCFLLLLSGIWLSWRFTLGVLAGGILANVNFHLLHKALIKLFIKNKGVKGFIFKSLFRFLVSGVIIGILLKEGWVNILGLFLGLSVVVINLTILALEEVKVLVFNRR